MGLASLPLIALAALFVASSLIIDCVVELQKYNAQNLSGALISLGLLRELGPLIVGLAWSARIAVIISNQAAESFKQKEELSFVNFILPRLLAGLTMAIPLAIYGLVVGFITACLVAPLVGKTSSIDFLESARSAVRYKDVIIYFIKLVLINSTIGVLVGSYCGINAKGNSNVAIDRAVTCTFIIGYLANLIVTYFAYFLWPL
jgi:phospholipid/cholesterol/gamma-HCH transport system permease protein